MKIGFIIIILLFINSCEYRTPVENYKKVLIHRFGISNEKQKTDTSYLELITDSVSKISLYKLYNHPDSSQIYCYVKRLNTDDSILFYNNHPCQKLDSKKYIINGKEYDVGCFSFDIDNSSDEESIIYYNEDYGLLIIYNYGWLFMEAIFEYNEESNMLIRKIISDTTIDLPLIDREELIKSF